MRWVSPSPPHLRSPAVPVLLIILIGITGCSMTERRVASDAFDPPRRAAPSPSPSPSSDLRSSARALCRELNGTRPRSFLRGRMGMWTTTCANYGLPHGGPCPRRVECDAATERCRALRESCQLCKTIGGEPRLDCTGLED
jgi:hypothetical protein